jgi:hypothetical protein
MDETEERGKDKWRKRGTSLVVFVTSAQTTNMTKKEGRML